MKSTKEMLGDAKNFWQKCRCDFLGDFLGDEATPKDGDIEVDTHRIHVTGIFTS